MKKSDLKEMIKQGQELVSTHTGIEMLFDFYAGGTYILNKDDDDVIEVLETEQDCIELINSMNKEGYNTCYYKPVIVDSNTGERITRKTIDNYKL